MACHNQRRLRIIITTIPFDTVHDLLLGHKCELSTEAAELLDLYDTGSIGALLNSCAFWDGKARLWQMHWPCCSRELRMKVDRKVGHYVKTMWLLQFIAYSALTEHDIIIPAWCLFAVSSQGHLH